MSSVEVDALVAPKARSAPSSVMSEPRGSHALFAVRRRDDRTVALSQIVHLTLRCMFEPDASFDKQRRLIAYAPILQPVCVVR